MNKKNCLIVIAVAVVSFVLGFMVKFIISEPNVKDVQENEVDEKGIDQLNETNPSIPVLQVGN